MLPFPSPFPLSAAFTFPRGLRFNPVDPAEEGVVGLGEALPDDEDEGVILEGADDTPRSFSAMFGRSFMTGVQYCVKFKNESARGNAAMQQEIKRALMKSQGDVSATQSCALISPRGRHNGRKGQRTNQIR